MSSNHNRDRAARSSNNEFSCHVENNQYINNISEECMYHLLSVLNRMERLMDSIHRLQIKSHDSNLQSRVEPYREQRWHSDSIHQALTAASKENGERWLQIIGKSMES